MSNFRSSGHRGSGGNRGFKGGRGRGGWNKKPLPRASADAFESGHDGSNLSQHLVRAQRREKVRECVIEGVAVLRIIKHCRESLPTLVAGSLLGLDVGDRLEVTNCFAHPAHGVSEDEWGDVSGEVDGSSGAGSEQPEGIEYQIEMMRMLREVNVDNNCVGWYRSTYLGSFINAETVEMQFHYQETLPNSVVLVYDPFRTTRGNLALRAFRLSDTFMSHYRSKKFELTAEQLAKIYAEEALEELPIRVRNSQLVSAMLMDLDAKDTARAALTSAAAVSAGEESKHEGIPVAFDCDFDRFDLSMSSYLEKNMEFLLESVDRLSSEMSNLQHYDRQIGRHKTQHQAWVQKRKLENEERAKKGLDPLPLEDPNWKLPQPPNRLESLLVSSQIENYCESINKFTGESFAKLFLASSLQKGQ